VRGYWATTSQLKDRFGIQLVCGIWKVGIGLCTEKQRHATAKRKKKNIGLTLKDAL